jgi:hypothetical protein
MWIKLIVGAAVVGGLGGLLLPHPKGKPAKPDQSVVAPPAVPETPEQVHPQPEIAAPTGSAKSTVSHIDITVLPTGGSLFLDDKQVNGNAIHLTVPRSNTLHVVQAKVAGYVPFKRNITYASDVNLTIRLPREPEIVATKSPAPPVIAQPPRVEVKAPPVAPPTEEFGMDMQRPPIKRPSRRVDENDPYVIPGSN